MSAEFSLLYLRTPVGKQVAKALPATYLRVEVVREYDRPTVGMTLDVVA